MARKKTKNPSGTKSASSTVARLPVGPSWWLAMRVMETPLDDAPDGMALVVWAMDDGRLAGAQPIPRGPQLLRSIAQSTLRVMREPAVGRPHRPRVLHVSDPQLAATLRATLSGAVRVVEEPTPAELEGVLDDMVQQLAPIPLVPDAPRSLLDQLYRGAAILYELAPWSIELPIILRSIDEELDGRIVTLMGRDDDDRGFFAVESEDALATMMSMGALGPKAMPPCLSLRYTTPDPAARARIRELRLPLAGPAALPTVATIVEGAPQEADEDDLIVIVGITQALAIGLARHGDDIRAGRSFVAHATISHRGRPVEVELECGVDDDEDLDEREMLEDERERLEDWLGDLLEQAETELELDDAVAEPSWVKDLPKGRRAEATRLLERLALVREHLEEVERELDEELPLRG